MEQSKQGPNKNILDADVVAGSLDDEDDVDEEVVSIEVDIPEVVVLDSEVDEVVSSDAVVEVVEVVDSSVVEDSVVVVVVSWVGVGDSVMVVVDSSTLKLGTTSQ
jgi:hypothetical protein